MQTPAFAATKTVRTWKLFRGLIWVAAVMAACLCPTLVFGQTNSTWNGGTGNWSDLGNWNPAAVPNNSGTTTYDVKIGAANSNVTMDVLNDTIDNLTIASKNSLTIDAGDSLSLVSGTSFNSGTIDVIGRLNNDLGSAFTNAGTITSTSTTGLLSNFGTFINNGTISNVTISNNSFPTPDAIFTNNGTITTAANGDLNNLDFNAFTNNGKITIVATSDLINSGAFQNFGTIYNNGLLNNSPAASGDGSFLNAGTINNNAGGSLQNGIVNVFDNSGTINNAGSLSTFFDLENGGKINNRGTLDNEDFLNNRGTIDNRGTLYNSSTSTNNQFATLNNFGTLNNSGTINNISEVGARGALFDNSGTLNNSGTINNMDGQSLTNEGTFKNSGTLFNDSTSTIGNSGTLTSPGTINNNGTFNNTGTITNRGTLNNTASATFTNDGTLTNYGKINSSGEFSQGDFPNNTGSLTNYSTISNSGFMELSKGPVINNGTIINSRDIDSGAHTGTFTNNGSITITSGANFFNFGGMTNNGTIYIKTGGFYDNASCACNDGGLLNNGKIIDAGSMNNDIVNEIDSPGTLIITTTGELSNNFILNTNVLINNGMVSTSGLLANDGVFRNAGTIDVSFEGGFVPASISNGGTLTNGGTINIQASVEGSSNTLGNSGTIINTGTINNADIIGNGGTITNRGTLNIMAGAVMSNLAGSTYLQTSGQTIVNGTLNSVPAVQIQGGRLSGSGIINGDVIMGGKLSPGNSPGILTINGNYTQTAFGAYIAELAGLTAGTGYDQLDVNGTADLAGKLDVSLLNGFTVALGDNFILMNYDSETGTFGMVDLPKLSNGLKWDLSYDPGFLDLSVTGTAATPAIATTPEPSTYLLWGAVGLLGIGIWVRRKFSRGLRSSV